MADQITPTASDGLEEISAAQAAARAAAVKPHWLVVGIAVCMGALVASWALPMGSLASLIVPWAIVVAEIALLLAWFFSMKVHLGLAARFRPWHIAAGIFFGLMAMNVVFAVILLVPKWSRGTLIVLALLCGLAAGVITYSVGNWRTRQWLRMGSQ